MFFDFLSSYLGKLFATGVITSPNYPDHYPHNLVRTETIQVSEDQILSLEFTAFDIQWHPICIADHLTITDGDGTTLMGKSCGSSKDGNILTVGSGDQLGSTLPANITSRTNTVNLVFSTSAAYSNSGWSVMWSARAPGECHQHV